MVGSRWPVSRESSRIGCSRELGVDARGPEEQQPLDAVLERRVHDVDLDAQVVAEEVHRVGVVGQDAADLGRGQHDVARPGLGEELEDCVAVLQIELGGRAPDEVGEALGFQLAPDRRPDQAAVAGDVDRGVAVQRPGAKSSSLRRDRLLCQPSRSTVSIQCLPACLSASMSASTMMRASSGVVHRRLPAELRLGLGGVADQRVDLGRPQVALIEADVVLPVEPGVLEETEEVADGVVAAGGQDEVVGLVGLQHPPHALDVLRGIAPVADGVEVAHVEHGPACRP